MARHDSILARILKGTADANVPFDGLRSLLGQLGFDERIRGSHHIFTKSGVEEILTSNRRDGMRKPIRSSRCEASL